MVTKRVSPLSPMNGIGFLVERCHVRSCGLVFWRREEGKAIWRWRVGRFDLLFIVAFDGSSLARHWYQRLCGILFCRWGQCEVFRCWRVLRFVWLSSAFGFIIEMHFIIFRKTHIRSWR